MNKTEPETKPKTIEQAILEAQIKIGAAKKDAANPFFKSAYADLGSVMEACKGPCNEAGIAILQPVGFDDKGEYVETLLIHGESGTSMSFKMRIRPAERMVLPPKVAAGETPAFTPYLASDPQAQGSAISYARRYSLQSLLFIPAKDDDGESAMGRTPEKPASRPQRGTQGADDF